MTNYYISIPLAAQRRHDMLAEAEAARSRPDRRKSSWRLPGRRPGPRSAGGARLTVLRDGSEVLIRPVQRTDGPLLADGFARLSDRSRWMRFLGPKVRLSPADLRYLTDIDHRDHEALGALSQADGRGVGIARYIRSADDARSAEIAITVVDEWQRRGLGAELMAQLSERAREEGIHRFTGVVAADNRAAAELARAMGADPSYCEPTTVPGTPGSAPRLDGCRRRRAFPQLWPLLNAQALLDGKIRPESRR